MGFFSIDIGIILNHCDSIMSQHRKFVYQVEQTFNDPGQKVTIRKVVAINEKDEQKAVQLVQSQYRPGKIVNVDLQCVTDYIE